VNKKVIIKAKNGDGASYFAIGNIYLDKKESTKAINWYYLGADKNHPGSQFQIGYMFTHGQGVSEDYKLGIEWFLKADSNGNIDAANNIGLLYARGEGVRIDNIAAFKWILRAVNNGCREALHNIGCCHDFGLGTIVDRQCALEWYQKSAELGDKKSKQRIKIRNEQGFYIDIKQASTCWVILLLLYIKCLTIEFHSILGYLQMEMDIKNEKAKAKTLGNKMKKMEQKLSKAKENETQRDNEIKLLKQENKLLKQENELLKLKMYIDSKELSDLEEKNVQQLGEKVSRIKIDK
jgi:hypothetical protein